MNNHLSKTIKNEMFSHHYQLLYNLNDFKPFGVEILFRSSLFSNPQRAFQKAKELNKLYELETTSISKAITDIHLNSIQGQIPDHLFINVYPSTLIHDDFVKTMKNLIEQTSISASNIVFEINEEELITDHYSLHNAASNLKEEGFHIAVDDFGKGYGSIQTVIEIEPSYIKMDKFFADEIEYSTHKQEMLKSMVTYCEKIKSNIVLEGIETPEQFFKARELGIKLGQGFLLARPCPLEDL
ncbi:EAL domain-containing protein (putative c-di-GMP-specific phosphodiesterase class I) [Alkalibacillus filiformis]|uniref:EAL domain-containing protein (Putative c-di-GMP-specific phosphodiesterase class I) n=1 Tax=Alkalibacillus filiformis TaxID=200990 RepID=A0ABU0DVY2_9BACI|nr:EAL domain-containing protein [Alkalibacillus filiformis]MDQ0352520.1 EAL domain-containing protein (putative c-di-GMP-specific phosphodiesterase class I) [Alkalibacillus filiformis]